MPTTRRLAPPTVQLSPILRRNAEATPRSHGHLVRAHGVATGDQGEHWAAERPVWILGTELECVDRSWDRNCRLSISSMRPKERTRVPISVRAFPFRLDKVRESPAVPKPKFLRGRGIGGHGRAHDRRHDCYDD